MGSFWDDRGVEDGPEEYFERGEQLESWLETHGEEAAALWIRIAKKHTGPADRAVRCNARGGRAAAP
jgi:hypothetical protein